MNVGVYCFLFVIRMDNHGAMTKVSRKRMVPNATVHHIPCEIEYTGNAPVNDYFVIKEDNQIKEAMFRGRLLQGKERSLPKDLEGTSNGIYFTSRCSAGKGKRNGSTRHL